MNTASTEPGAHRDERRWAVRSLRTAAIVGLAVSVSLVSASCTSGSSGESGGSSNATSSPAASSSITIDEQALQTTVTELADEMLAPGVGVLIRSPQGDFNFADGTTRVDGRTPVTLDDHVRIGSNTKTFVATVILQLAEEGRLDLAGPVSDYWEGVPNGENITVEQLLNMRSGLFNYSETVKLNRSLDNDPQRVWTPRELLRMGLSRPPYFAPGEGWHYSNTNTVLLGLIAEKLEGKPLEQILRDRFFTELSLRNTSFPPSTTSAIPRRHPQGYMYGTNVETMDDPALPPAQQKAAQKGKLAPFDVTDMNPSWTWAAGQMISTAGDLATWVKALGDGTLLSPEMQSARLDSVAPADASLPAGGAEYGLGIAKLGPIYGHTGELPGFNSVMGYDPQNDLTIVVWSNLGSAPNGDAVAITITRELIAQIYAAPDEGEAPQPTD